MNETQGNCTKQAKFLIVIYEVFTTKHMIRKSCRSSEGQIVCYTQKFETNEVNVMTVLEQVWKQLFPTCISEGFA